MGETETKSHAKIRLTRPGERNKGQSAFNKLNASSSEREKKPHRLNIGKRKLKKQNNMNSGEKINLYPLRPKKHARHAA
ncbi:hypothetical protein ECO9534_13877 [Escherichia coli O111:H11 str. CVM9534]|uniref:hypothetical protein n=1 Tax=Escherichia coli TaxID=562 RepID=UPI0002636800|nr:hypothetical protein [Escherichia coli]EIL06920.1 hypothetical protein ECO9534_13877 [Escherichia coli O111:H11 str. CVM9534]